MRPCLAAASVFLALTGIEIGFAAGWLGPSNADLLRNYRINLRNHALSRENPLGFNDALRSIQKPPGTFRIAVLGNSFIWGDGVPYEMIWSHKLERLVRARRTDVEVISWGKYGWSTLDQFDFLRTKGVTYRPDLLVVCFVTNDPDLKAFPQQRWDWHRSRWLSPLWSFFPRTVEFAASKIGPLVVLGLPYDDWEERLYTEANLRRYGILLKQFADFCRAERIPLLFVLTPNDHSDVFRVRFEKVKPLLDAADIEHLDLHPAVVRRFGGLPPEGLRAGPANGHPGDLLTTFFAEETLRHIEVRGLLPTPAPPFVDAPARRP